MTGFPVESLLKLLEGLDRLEIPYMVSGSAASGIYGHVRTTRDVDIVVHLRPENITDLVEQLRPDFYIDEDQIDAALRRSRSFNVIHFQSAYKFDIFPVTEDRYQQAQFARRRFTETTIFGPDPIELCVASPEDSILSKLDWYRKGNRVSTTQWNDVLGVIELQRDRLDMTYLREWAAYLKISDLLEQALAERHEPLA